MAVKASVLAKLVAAGIVATTPEADLKKAYFKAAGGPLSKSMLPDVVAALGGDTSKVVDDSAAAAAAPKPAKEKKERPAAAPKVQETPEQALARLKGSSDTKIATRWARVREVLEMGKRGPTKVRIVCDDKGPNGEELLRDIKVQDLFQVKFSAGYKKPKSQKEVPAATA